MDTMAPTAERQATTNTSALSNGKIVVLSEYGWHQPRKQHDEHGALNAAEVTEAWKLWDAAQVSR